MRDFAKISCAIWGSKKFSKLSDESKLLYLYFHTSPHCNSVGCYYIPKGYIKVDMNWNDRAIDRAIKGLSEGLIQWNNDEEIVKINNFLRHSPITNKKHAIGSAKIALSLPICNEKSFLIKDLQQIPWCKDIKELSDYDTTIIDLSEGYHTETETETETETKKNNTKKSPDLFDGDNEELKGKKKNEQSNRKCQISKVLKSSDEIPDEYLQYATDHGIRNIPQLFKRWHEWWDAEAGLKAGSKGWLLTWQGKVRKEQDRQGGGISNNQKRTRNSPNSTIDNARMVADGFGD